MFTLYISPTIKKEDVSFHERTFFQKLQRHQSQRTKDKSPSSQVIPILKCDRGMTCICVLTEHRPSNPSPESLPRQQTLRGTIRKVPGSKMVLSVRFDRVQVYQVLYSKLSGIKYQKSIKKLLLKLKVLSKFEIGRFPTTLVCVDGKAMIQVSIQPSA
ncbi:MAG: hypothetical protein PUP92_34565 [Rhizonema sp. PD38]|nr:hypothetical protein [Rhizonema sp. PD38]